VPASASLSLAAVVDHVGGMELPDPVVLAPDLRDVLGSVVDPRKRRGVRHSLGVVLTVVVCAVVAGARSFVAIAEWVADLPDELAQTLDTDRRRPSESAIRRLLGKMDADRFDSAMGGFVQHLCVQVAPVGRRRVLAVDGKTVRGSRHTRSDGTEITGRHLLAVIDQHTRVVLGQLGVDGKTSEINRFAPLLDTLTGIDLTGVVITADALHTQREHVTDLRTRGAHWVLTVKGNQPTLRRQLAGLPWREVEVGHRSTETSHGRREIRALKVVTIAAGIEFPHARQAVQIVRRTRPVSARTGRKGRWRTETVYAVTDLAPHQARPDELAAWIRGHWQIENGLH
jgi:predicted transposase YbfD/YdcC